MITDWTDGRWPRRNQSSKSEILSRDPSCDPIPLGLEAAEVTSDWERRCSGGETAAAERRLRWRREAVAEPGGCDDELH
jgi:hypothetical protein